MCDQQNRADNDNQKDGEIKMADFDTALYDVIYERVRSLQEEFDEISLSRMIYGGCPPGKRKKVIPIELDDNLYLSDTDRAIIGAAQSLCGDFSIPEDKKQWSGKESDGILWKHRENFECFRCGIYGLYALPLVNSKTKKVRRLVRQYVKICYKQNCFIADCYGRLTLPVSTGNSRFLEFVDNKARGFLLAHLSVINKAIENFRYEEDIIQPRRKELVKLFNVKRNAPDSTKRELMLLGFL